MPIIIPESTDQRFVFPYLDISKSFRYAHYRPEVTKFRLTMKSMDSFFVSLHKVTAYEFAQISRNQKIMGCAILPLLVVLIIFGVLLGINYKGNTEPFMVRFSLGIIFSACGIFFILLIYFLTMNWLIKRQIRTRIQSVINETRASFARARVKWVMPKLDFPYWLELYIDQGAGLPDYSVNIMSPATAIPSPSASAFLVNRNLSNEHDLGDASKLMPPASPKDNGMSVNMGNEHYNGDASKFMPPVSKDATVNEYEFGDASKLIPPPSKDGEKSENITPENVDVVVK